MTDKEKLLKILNNCDGSIEDILFAFLNTYQSDFSAMRIYDLIDDLNKDFLYYSIKKLENIKAVSQERAFYLKTYLNGDMWQTEEDARRNLQPQINNAQAIIDVCNRKF